MSSGISSALNSGKTSLETNQAALAITGNNIANLNTEGYSRQTVVFGSTPAFSQRGYFVGQGVRVDTVQREHNRFLENQLLDKKAEYGYANAQTDALAEMERIFPITDDNLAADLGNFFDSFRQLSTDPSDQVLRNTVLQKGEDLADRFNNSANELLTLQSNISQSITGKLDSINTRLNEIASLNNRIQTIEVSGQEANGQRDQQEAMIRDLAESLGAETVASSSGMLSLHLPNGLPLVQGTTPSQLSYELNGGEITLNLEVAGERKELNADSVGGDMKGVLEMRDETIPSVLESLDKLAFSVINAVNEQHGKGVTPSGAKGGNFFVPAPNQGQNAQPNQPEYADAARLMKMSVSKPDEIAAGLSEKSGDNENSLAMAELGGKKNNSDTFASSYSKLASNVGSLASRNKLTAAGAATAVTQVENLKEAASGVSLDEEMVNLIQFQRSFQSSAKFLSTVDEMMETLISIA